MQGRTSEVVHEMISELALTIIAPGVGAGADLVVVPPPELLGLPWTAMGRSVDPGLSVTVAPSAGMWARADGLARRQASLGVVAGPRLEFAASEAGRVAGLFDDEAEQLAGTAATVEAMLQTMGRCDRLHAVAHTLLRDDNPMFSSLELADGFLNLYDLEGLESVPDTVVLSACDSAHDNVVGGYEMYGLTSVLLSRGTRSVIATVAPIPDSAESVEAVVRIHTALKEGATAAAAVRDAQIGFDDTVDPSVAFVAYGA
jgi:CHAT domain-containing protein